MMGLSWRMAWRSLGRSRRRTALSILGVSVGCAIAVFALAFMRGGRELRVRAISESGFGHARIAPVGWAQSRRDELRLQSWQQVLARARAVDGVAVVAPHARTPGLLAFGTRAVGVQLLGVDARAEPQINRLVRALVAGRYLNPGEEGVVVVGKALVERLDVELGDALLLTLARADGELEYAMLEIVGIVDTGSREIDHSICHVALAEMEKLTGLAGAGEISLVFAQASTIEEKVAELAALVGEGNEVLSWRQVLPAMGGRCGWGPGLYQSLYRYCRCGGRAGGDQCAVDGDAGAPPRICRANGAGHEGRPTAAPRAFRGGATGFDGRCSRLGFSGLSRVLYGDERHRFLLFNERGYCHFRRFFRSRYLR